VKAAVLGATRGMGRALARRLAERGDALALLGRSPSDLERSARDLEVRGGIATGSIKTCLCDLEDPSTFAPALAAAGASLGSLDAVIVTAGAFATQAQLEDDPALLERLLRVDFANTVLFCEEARRRLLGRGGGTLCVFSSVAGDRGRKPVILYGAAKAGLSRYLEALDHRYRREGLRVVCVKPGFVRTGMTAGLPEPPFAGDPDDVARVVARGLDRGAPVVYAPPIWRWIMLVIRLLPRTAMRRVGF
jgi:NAD(P)-dependent dehydrogenase (short-subunit alcohol dehydrogenase family)